MTTRSKKNSRNVATDNITDRLTIGTISVTDMECCYIIREFWQPSASDNQQTPEEIIVNCNVNN